MNSFYFETKSEILKKALGYIKEVDNKDEKIKKEYVQFTKKLPVLIMKNGLISTLLYIKKKSKKEEGEVGENTFNIIGDHISKFISFESTDLNSLIESLIDKKTLSENILITRRVINFSCYLKEVAEALLEV